MRGIQIVLLFLIWNQIFSEEHNDDDVVIDDDDSELATSGKFLKMGTLGPTLLIKSKSADTRRWCTHSQVETTNSSQQTYGRVYYRYSEAFEFKDGLLLCIDAVLRFTLSIKFRL